MNFDFNNVSIRGRVAYATICLENAIKFYNKDNLDWSFVFNLIWSYTKDNVGSWHYPMAESTPRSILFPVDFETKEMEFLNLEQYHKLYKLYNSSNDIINSIINKIFEIGTRDLYSSISNNSQDTIIYLQEIINLMLQNHIPLPDKKIFDKFSITENDGWGREFTREEIF